MKTKLALIVLFVLGQVWQAQSQTCTALGQTPATAFPVCGTTVFKQSNVPICSTNSLFVPGCTGNSNANYANKNPYWYRFTCYQTGSLGFVITPNDPKDDYDWQLYDITGLDPNEVFTNKTIVVTGNWAGNPGPTGTSSSGSNFIQCASDYNGTENRFAQMPTILQGHTYILLVSHFTDSQSGYSLSFGGGTAVITDPKNPAMLTATPDCTGKVISIKLNKQMKCNSISANGSEFTINYPGVHVISTVGVNCSQSFDLDSLVLMLDNPLPPGNYTVTIKKGTDGNTILDNCDREIPENDFLSFKILPLAPTPFDSIAPVKCAPKELTLVFGKQMQCSSIAANGSDFRITGPSPVTIVSAGGNCTNGLSRTITLKLAGPIVVGGHYTVILQRASDGGLLIDECDQATPPVYRVSFDIKDTVNADFNYNINWGCKIDTVQFTHPGNHGVNQWNWQLDYAGPSSQQNPLTYYNVFGPKTITLAVSNGFCSDTVKKIVNLDNELKADFSMNPIMCPEDSAVFLNKSIGKNMRFAWNFGNGITSPDSIPPPQRYPLTGIETDYPIRLIVSNASCSDTLVKPLKVLKSCYIAVPNAFTPNGDGLNDYLYPLNAFKADKLEFRVYNRDGLLVFSSTRYDQKWDGTYKGEPQDAGVYVWTLQYVHHDTGKFFSLKGSSMLIR